MPKSPDSKTVESLLNRLPNTAVQIDEFDNSTNQVFIRVVGQWNWAIWEVLEQSLQEKMPGWRIGRKLLQ